MTIGENDRLIPISAVPMLLVELTGIFRCKATVYNWTRKGCRTIDGRIVKLEIKKRLKQIFTTRSAVKEFINAVG